MPSYIASDGTVMMGPDPSNSFYVDGRQTNVQGRGIILQPRLPIIRPLTSGDDADPNATWLGQQASAVSGTLMGYIQQVAGPSLTVVAFVLGLMLVIAIGSAVYKKI